MHTCWYLVWRREARFIANCAGPSCTPLNAEQQDVEGPSLDNGSFLNIMARNMGLGYLSDIHARYSATELLVRLSCG